MSESVIYTKQSENWTNEMIFLLTLSLQVGGRYRIIDNKPSRPKKKKKKPIKIKLKNSREDWALTFRGIKEEPCLWHLSGSETNNKKNKHLINTYLPNNE